MTSRNGFKYPEKGPVVCPDWDPRPVCGNGLHGLPWGEGNASYLSFAEDAKWLVIRVKESDVVCIDGDKCKFSKGTVVYCGDRDGATSYILNHGGKGRAVVFATATAGDEGTATAGDYGTATAGNEGTATAGYRGTATAGDRGTATAGNDGTATAGDYGTATAGDYGTATAGYYGTATAGYYGTATAGDRGTATAGDFGTATAGNFGTATAGNYGIIQIKYWDGKRYRILTGYIGEDGLDPDIAYHVEDGKFVKKGLTSLHSGNLSWR
jgi:hypothetical protein